MTLFRASALVGIVGVTVSLFVLPILAQRGTNSGERSGETAAARTDADAGDGDEAANAPQFKLSRIGSGFGPNLEHLRAAIDNDKVKFTQLDSLRRVFWATQPDNPQRETLRKLYAEALLEKDFQLLYGGVTTGSRGFMTAIYSQTLDGGVPEAASPAFDRWIEAIRDHMGMRDNQPYQQIENLKAFNLDRFSRAFEATRQFEEQYMLLRDWSEFQKAGREQEFYPTPESYVVYLQLIDGDPLSHQQAVVRYGQLAAMFGEATLNTAANQQRVKRMTADGLVRGSRMKPMYDFFEQLSQGSDAGFIFNQFRMIARSEDRWAEAISDFQEMVSLIDPKVALAAAAEARRDPQATLGDFVRVLLQAGDRECFLVVAARAKGMQWKAASKQYEALSEIYGEDKVLRAARIVRTAKTYDNYQIEIPAELADGVKRSKPIAIFCEDAIARLLKLETRKTEWNGKLYDQSTTTLSRENLISSSLLPSKYSGGRVVADSSGFAVSVAGAPTIVGLFGGLLGGDPKMSRVLIFSTDSDRSPVAIHGVETHPSGKAMDFSNDYVVVGYPSAWLSDPKTGRGPRLNAGEAHVYSRKTGKLVTNVRPPRDSLMPGLWFGSAVAAHGDFIAVGATGKRGRSEDEGEVNIHDARTGEHRFRITMRPEDQAHLSFGENIATDGTTLMITAPGADEASHRNPAVFLHKAADGKFIAKLECPTSENCFVASIAVSGKWAVVGFPMHSYGGAALVYDVSTGKLHSVLKNTTTYQNLDDLGDGTLRQLIVRVDQLDYSFGKSVAVQGDTVVVASRRSLHVFDARSSRHLQTIPVGKGINSDLREIHDIATDGKTIIATTHSSIGDDENWTHHRVELNLHNAR